MDYNYYKLRCNDGEIYDLETKERYNNAAGVLLDPLHAEFINIGVAVIRINSISRIAIVPMTREEMKIESYN